MPLTIRLTDLSTPQAWILPDASASSDGIMTALQVAQLTLALNDIIQLQSNDGQRPVPFADGVQTVDDTTTNMALLSTTDNPARVFRASVTVVAWSEDGLDTYSVQSIATFQGDGAGLFALVAVVDGTPQATGGAVAWTMDLVVVDGMPVAQVTGNAVRAINWMIFVDNWSAP
jgi:hypothetical protein